MICQKLDSSVMKTRFSPFRKDWLAIASSENFGLAGISLIQLFQFSLEKGLAQPISGVKVQNSVQGLVFSEQ